MTSSEILASVEQQLAAAVTKYVWQLKQATTSKIAQEIMYAFNKETQNIVAAAEQLITEKNPGQQNQPYIDTMKQKLIEAMDEIEIHASAGF